jgi:hypothetical protein
VNRPFRVITLVACLPIVVTACTGDPPDSIQAARLHEAPVVVDNEAEALAHNGGKLFDFVVDSTGYIRTPATLPTGNVMITLTYIGKTPFPHSLIFEGLNGNEPITAVDTPGSNNGTVTLPPGPIVFYDGAPGNRANGYEGKLDVVGPPPALGANTPRAVADWTTAGVAFTSAPRNHLPADVPIELHLTVGDALPHSIAFEGVRGGEPLLAVDGPGQNERTVTLPAGTYIYYCAVPGHRQAGMEGLITIA